MKRIFLLLALSTPAYPCDFTTDKLLSPQMDEYIHCCGTEPYYSEYDME